MHAKKRKPRRSGSRTEAKRKTHEIVITNYSWAATSRQGQRPLSVTDGQVLIGFVEVVDRRYRTINTNVKVVGQFATQQQAMCAPPGNGSAA
jgi:hypothetical protein